MLSEVDTVKEAEGSSPIFRQFMDVLGQVGSIEGRVAVHHVEDGAQSKNFTFKCHRDGTDIFSVNSIAFHPQYAPLLAQLERLLQRSAAVTVV